MRFLKAVGIAATVAIAYMLIIACWAEDRWRVGPELLLPLVPSAIGIIIGGGLFRLMRMDPPIKWYHRLGCAVLSGCLSLAALFGLALLGMSGPPRDDTAVYIVVGGLFVLTSPVAVITGIVFGAGAGQRANE